jgi:transcription initiation factor TFIIB
MAGLLGLPKGFREEAALLYRRGAARGLVRGRTIPGMVAASIYVTCRRMGVPRTLEEVVEATDVDRRDLVLSYRALLRGLRLALPPPRAADYIVRFASRLALPWEVEALALQLVRRVEEEEKYSSRAPAGTAAAAIYLAALLRGQKVSQDKIGAVAGVSEVTIRIRYTAIVEELGIDLPAHQRVGESQTL